MKQEKSRSLAIQSYGVVKKSYSLWGSYEKKTGSSKK